MKPHSDKNKMSSVCVVTTIGSPTPQLKEWESIFGNRLIVIGDRKTPSEWTCGNATFFSLEEQDRRHFMSIKYTPQDSYTRKNIGYLLAMTYSPDSIYESDDDNTPTGWSGRVVKCEAEVVKEKGWLNVYRSFIGKHIWPRGFPLDRLDREKAQPSKNEIKLIDSPIQQGLVDGNPDVDAIWRLVVPQSIRFDIKWSVALGPGAWCPFNSQSTWWFPEAYPLMYLPIGATFRMTDIWRSFVAQRCLWTMGKMVTFHSPSEVNQDRNPHDLMKDFALEIPGYLNNGKIADCLWNLRLKRGKKWIYDNLRDCYVELVSRNFLPEEELESVNNWILDVKKIRGD